MASKRFNFPKRGGVADQNFGELRERSGAENDPDFLYYNAMIINNSTDTTQKSPDPPIKYQDTRSLPILNDKSKYAVSVENFSFSGSGKTLPIFIPQVREYNTDGSLNQNPDNTVYDVTFTWKVGSQYYQSLRSVQWIPEDQAVWTEKPRTLAQNVAFGTYAYPQPEIPYYYCYTYTNWLNCVNNALRLAWEDVKTAVTTGGTPVLTLTLARLTGGTPTPGEQYWLFDSETSTTPLDDGYVYSFDGNTLKLIGTDPTVTWSPTYYIANDVGGVEPATIAAEITETSLVTDYDAPSAFGTKCPFFKYDPATNLFSLYQDSNTCIVPYGQTVPGQLSVFGSSSDPSYSAGEFSSVGFNSNLEGLLSNFDTTYYSDQVPLAFGVTITSPVGTETSTQNLVVSSVSTTIDTYDDKVLTADISGVSNNLASANWKFAEVPVISTTTFASGSSSPFLFGIDNAIIPDYYGPGLAVIFTDPAGASVQGIITAINTGPIEIEVTGVGSFGPDIYDNWTLSLAPLTSNTAVTASVGTKLTLNTNLDYTQSPLFDAGLSVTTAGFDATVNSFGEGLAYENVQGGTTIFSSTTGLLTVDKTYLDGDGNFKFSGPFVVGDTVTDPSTGGSAVIESISGDNGYTTLTFSQQKNPFAIGHTVDSFVSLADTTNTICDGVIVDIIGDNTGYGTVNITNQNGKFGIGEVIVNNFNDSIATIVGIEGTNNGYATVAYINQTTTGAPGSFVPGEFLLSEGLAFAQVVIDNQNVINQTEGNIGNVTCITGIEVAGIFTPTSNIPLPSPGQQIQGTQSGTIADFGGVAYLESATLTVSNIAGSFNVGDIIVDNVGYGLASANTTISVTATCNGFAYLGGGQLILKNTKGGQSAPATFNTSNLLIDFDSSSPGTATNTTSVTVSNITPFTQFLNGDPVTASPSGATGKVVLNCGPVPYGSPDTTTQLLTILPDPGSTAFQPGDTLTDSNVGATLTIEIDTPRDYFGSFSIGDQVAQNNISDVTLTSFSPPQSTFTLGASVTLATGTIVTGNTSGAVGTIVSGGGSSYVVGSIVGSFIKTEKIFWFTADTQGILNSYTDPTTTFTLEASVTIPISSVVIGTLTGATGTVTSGSGTSYGVTITEGIFDPKEEIYWETPGTTATLASPNGVNPVSTFVLTSSQSFAVGTILTGVTSNATGVVYSGSGTNYVVYITSGTFTNGEYLRNNVNISSNTVSSWSSPNLNVGTSTNLPVGTYIVDDVSGAKGSVLSGSGTNYVLTNITGTFGTGNALTIYLTDQLNNSTLVATSRVLVFTASKTSLLAGNTVYDLTSNALALILSGSGTTYLIGQITGTFANGDSLSWYLDSTVANLSSYTTPQTTFTLAATKTIPATTIIEGTVTNAVAQVVSGSGTSYVVSLLSGSFNQPEAIEWIIPNVTSQTLADYTPIQSTLTLGSSATIVENNTVTGQLSNASATIVSGSGQSYVVKNIFGTFQNGEKIQWNSDFAAITSYTTQDLNITITLSTPSVIPIGITITGSVSGAKGDILNVVAGSSNTRYRVGSIIGQFLQTENITWVITGNIVYIPTADVFHLINTSGTFTNGGQLINTRKQIYCDIRPTFYYDTGASARQGTWQPPFAGNSIFDWDTLCNGTVSYVYGFNPTDKHAIFYVNQESVNGRIKDGDTIGVLPFLSHGSTQPSATGGDVSPAGANITLKSNTANWQVGQVIWFANTNDNGAWSAKGVVSSFSRGPVTGTFVMDVSFKAFEARADVWGPGINGANYASRTETRTNPSDQMSGINYYTNGGQLVSPALANQNAYTTIKTAQSGSSTIGVIANVNISPSSAFIQTSKPPANDTTLTLQGVSGTFVADDLIESSGSFGNVADYTATNATSTFTSFAVGNTVSQQGGGSGVITALTPSTMTIESLTGSFVSGPIVNDTTDATADVTLVEGSLTMTPYKVRQSSGSNWTIIPTPLTSSTYQSPPYSLETFDMNLTSTQSLLKAGDPFLVSQTDSLLTVTQLYQPENVIQVNPSKLLNTFLLGQPFPSGTPTSLPYYTEVTQDYESTSSLWSPVQSIVIGTTFITVREEYSGTPITLGTGNLGSNATTASFQKVLLETPLQLLPQNGWRGQLFYEPKTETLSSLGLSKEELKNLDFQIYWRNRLTNTLTPLQLYNGGSASVRLLFKKIHE